MNRIDVRHHMLPAVRGGLPADLTAEQRDDIARGAAGRLFPRLC